MTESNASGVEESLMSKLAWDICLTVNKSIKKAKSKEEGRLDLPDTQGWTLRKSDVNNINIIIINEITLLDSLLSAVVQYNSKGVNCSWSFGSFQWLGEREERIWRSWEF